MDNLKRNIEIIKQSNASLYGKDFLLTWDKTFAELEMLMHVAEALKNLNDDNISTKCFDTGLAVSQFRDNSTRTRFSFASAANMLGLTVQDLDEGKSQIAHGETVRETSNMISFLTDLITNNSSSVKNRQCLGRLFFLRAGGVLLGRDSSEINLKLSGADISGILPARLMIMII